MWTKEAVVALRTKLGLTQADFAKAVGVDVRTVARWEAGDALPGGAAADVLTALRATLQKHPEKSSELAGFIAGTVAVGGLAFLVISLLEALLGGDKKPEPPAATNGQKGGKTT